MQAFVAPPDMVQQKKLAKLSRRPLPKDAGDALFAYEGFLPGLGDMSPNASPFIIASKREHVCVQKKVNNKNRKS